jgi:hypothetical protein
VARRGGENCLSDCKDTRQERLQVNGYVKMWREHSVLFFT